MSTLLSVTIANDGQTVSLVWDSPTFISNSSGLTLTPDGIVDTDVKNLSLPGGEYGNGTTEIDLIISSSRADYVPIGESYELNYSGIGAIADVTDPENPVILGAFGPVAVTNNSTQEYDEDPPSVSSIQVDSPGTDILITFSENMYNQGNLSSGWSIERDGGLSSVESANWVIGTSNTVLRLVINRAIKLSESTSSIRVSYSGNGFQDLTGNILPTFGPIAINENNSEVAIISTPSNSPIKYYVWTDIQGMTEQTFFNFRKNNPNTTINRIGTLTEVHWWPSDTSDPNASLYATAEEVSIPETFRDDFLVNRPQWTSLNAPTINLGIFRALLRKEFVTSSSPIQQDDIFDQLWQDPEPGGEWLSFADERRSDEEKEQVYAALKEINRVQIEEVGNNKAPVCWYRTFPLTTGRVTGSGFTYGGGTPAIAYAKNNLSPTAIDDTPLLGERTFYRSYDQWQTVFEKNESSNAKVFDEFGQHLQARIIIAYPTINMMEPDSPELIGTSAEGIAGGIELWKQDTQLQLDQITSDGKENIVVLRRVFGSYNLLQDTGSFDSSDEPFIPQSYWQEMIRWCVNNPKVSGVAFFSGGVFESANAGEGRTLADMHGEALSIIEEYNTSLINIQSPLRTTAEIYQTIANQYGLAAKYLDDFVEYLYFGFDSVIAINDPDVKMDLFDTFKNTWDSNRIGVSRPLLSSIRKLNEYAVQNSNYANIDQFLTGENLKVNPEFASLSESIGFTISESNIN